MTQLHRAVPSEEDTGFLVDLAQVCREIGRMIAQMEIALIDAAQDSDNATLPRQSLQQIDLIIQSTEELALLMERTSPDMVLDPQADREKIINPTRLEWIRNRLAGPVAEQIGPASNKGNGQVSLF